MSLPYLQHKRVSASIAAKAKSAGGVVDNPQDENERDPGLMTACDEIMSAIHAKDSMRLADALEAAIHMVNSGGELGDP